LSGDDISVVRPPFSIIPRSEVNGCIEDPPKRTEEVEVRNVPFDYAVPVLSGWDLFYECSDHHVAEVGIWLEDIRYEKNPGDSSGTLRYKVTSVLRDEGNSNGSAANYKVNILGFKGRKPADLIPQDVSCRRDPQGRLLFSVANIGEGDAPASITFISGNAGVVNIPTPPLPRSFVINLDPIDFSSLCFGDCNLRISVDDENVVEETNEFNNVGFEHCIG
jgi:hypothetical protein